ncbi:receptor kinase-like protein Xa21 [Quercus lobata]|uniref:receptor kinase-like protein Xa21 n=1 Tax=Quercus lobata TaxID=97700 RepID=UPI001244C19A|nr:receptor kinase-like protein Xa21 [Quercus lobata]
MFLHYFLKLLSFLASACGDVYSFGILLLEIIIAKKPTDGIFQEGLSINKFISEVHESKILDIADPRLFKDNESFSQSSSTNYSSGEDSSSKNKNNIAFRVEECVASMVRVGLSLLLIHQKNVLLWRSLIEVARD